MRFRCAFAVIFGSIGISIIHSKDPSLADESVRLAHFERAQALVRETMRKRDAKREEFLNHARIGDGSDSCLAFDITTGDCPIPKAEFERYLTSYFPDSLESISDERIAESAARARQAVIDQFLDRAFLEGYQSESMFSDPDRSESGNRSDHLFGSPYFPKILRAFRQFRVRVFAASDSAWLAARLADRNSGLRPVTMPARDLPDTLIRWLSSSTSDGWSPIHKTRFGYLTCSWFPPEPGPEPFEKLIPLISGIESRAAKESRPAALRMIGERAELCREEDSLDLVLRLTPLHRRPIGNQGPDWMRISSSELPASVKSLVSRKFAQGRTDTVGPVQGGFGIWTIRRGTAAVRFGRLIDSADCLAKVEAGLRSAREADLLQAEWETSASKTKDNPKNDIRTALLEQLSDQGAPPESLYIRMRRQWVARSLRFTEDIGLSN